ncbi:type II toxin-antitoxin system HicA family toxin [Waltera sp.]
MAGFCLISEILIHQYKHPSKSGKVTIPNHSGDIPLRVVNSIFKQAGLK